ncbi:CDP-alcohol phosphatidyltransferase family protein [Stappia sp. F7233]|uniref:CDP-diacylglycerol--glycerol-3-phosphate 3-phosphatidyltransferase n=1 Tax=Stappia albiluteola TaxID=2758565 RepID=A0A839ADH1_9HYPH|nr:CDP-alcohol phosphatidyltransferase family protein [Stappia albiluteola]MBA5776689.1 CDP-alcohol phosphatidyltransferase family protein [Stappia albiluteola]
MTLPNFITLARLIAVPFFVWLVIDERPATAFWVFLAAGLSDAADGYIARRYDLGSEIGAYLDPIADKALLVAAFVSLGVAGLIPSWLVIAAVARDLLIIGAVVFSWMLDQPVAMRPLFVSKANTLMQITLVCVVLGQRAFGVSVDILEGLLVWATGALTLASAGAYLITWLRHMSGDQTNVIPRADGNAKRSGGEEP